MGEVTEEGEASFLHPHSTLVGFLSPTADNLDSFSGKIGLVQ